MPVSEKIQLLGKGMYKDIPDELTLNAIPTSAELDYVGGDDFDKTMIEKIFPQAITEDINFSELLQVDYQWICRCLRILNYGPYHTTNNIMCSACGEVSSGEYQVDLRTVNCVPIPAGTKNEFQLTKESFIDFDGEITFKMLTMKELFASQQDKTFANKDGSINKQLSRICYMIKSFKGKTGMLPLEVKTLINKNLSPADFVILRNKMDEMTDFGLRAGGTCTCPKCGNTTAAYLALVDERFFRPTVGDLYAWRDDPDRRKD